MALANDIQNDIAAILDDPDYGRAATIHVDTKGTPDPSTQITPTTTRNYATRVILVSYRDSVIDGENIQRGDRKAIIKAKGLTIVPGPGMRMTVGADKYRIIEAKPGQIGSAGVYYNFVAQIRKGG